MSNPDKAGESEPASDARSRWGRTSLCGGKHKSRRLGRDSECNTDFLASLGAHSLCLLPR